MRCVHFQVVTPDGPTHPLPADTSVSFADVVTLSPRRASGGHHTRLSPLEDTRRIPKPVRPDPLLPTDAKAEGSLRRMRHGEAVAKQFTNHTVGLRSILLRRMIRRHVTARVGGGTESGTAQPPHQPPPPPVVCFPAPVPGSLMGPPVVHGTLAEEASAACECSTGVSTSLTEK
ncbi:hypothetical protein OPV22_021538 [Ensete ventricosum]|uniref:Uncharacterized protein n=1 Tax=Ensete ventricosum TaxID=4639 RepID=A0AAV8PD31_ENSVE|nr:hypothetical protein OPV22_021538 [Ensete ventricosum]